MRTLSFGNMILVFLIIISSKTVLSNDTDCKDIVKSIQESLTSIESKVNEYIRETKNSLDSLNNRYHKINFRQDKQESLDTQLKDILSEVKEIKEKSLTKDKQESLDTQLRDILSEVKEIKEKSLTKDKQESLDKQLRDILSEVKEIKEKSLTKVNFQDKQDSLETQLKDILSEVKEIKEKSFAKETTLTEIQNDVKHTKEVLNMKVKQSEAFEMSTDNKLEMILGEVKDLKNLRNMTDANVHSTNLKLKTIIEDQQSITGLLMDNHNVLNSQVKTVLSVVERLQEITEDSTLKQDAHFNSTNLKLETLIEENHNIADAYFSSTSLKLEAIIEDIRNNTDNHNVLNSEVKNVLSVVESLQEITKDFKNNYEKFTSRQDAHFNSTKLKLESIIGDIRENTDLFIYNDNVLNSKVKNVVSKVEILQKITKDFKNNYEKSTSRQDAHFNSIKLMIEKINGDIRTYTDAHFNSTKLKLETIIGDIRSNTDAHFNSTKLKLETIIGDIRSNTGIITEEVSNVFSEVANLEAITKDFKNICKSSSKQDEHFSLTNLKLATLIEENQDITDMLKDKHNLLNSRVKNVLSEVESLQEITKDFKNNYEKSTSRQDAHFNSNNSKLETIIEDIRKNTENCKNTGRRRISHTNLEALTIAVVLDKEILPPALKGYATYFITPKYIDLRI